MCGRVSTVLCADQRDVRQEWNYLQLQGGKKMHLKAKMHKKKLTKLNAESLQADLSGGDGAGLWSQPLPFCFCFPSSS